MRIRSIRLKNYKRFKDLTIDLGESPKKIIALVGPNGCGKSSIFDGMLFHANAYGRIGNSKPKDYRYHSLEQNPSYDFQNVSIIFDKGDFRKIQNEKAAQGKQNTIFSFRSPYRYNTDLRVKQSQATEDISKNSYGATYSSELDAKMEQNYRRLYIAYNKYLNDTDCKPSEARAKIIGDLNEAIKQCLDLEVVSIGDIEADKGTLFFKKADYDKEFDFNVLSSGEKEVIDILLDLYLRKNEYNDTIFLIDEPELHINTSIQRKLLLEINKLVGRECQIWIATHSIGFLRALQDELKNDCQIIQFDGSKKWASEPQVLKPIKKTVKKWREIFETALDDLTGLVSPKRIIYCEGKLQNSLDEKMYNQIFEQKYDDTIFLSSGNKNTVQKYSAIALSVLNRAFSNVEIVALTDRDDQLEEMKQNNIKIRKLTRREFENYLLDKEIIAKLCPTFDKIKYGQLVTDIVNDDVKAKMCEFKNICNCSSMPDRDFKDSLSKLITEDTSVFQELEKIIFQ